MTGATQLNFEDIVRTHSAMVARIAATYEARPALIEELTQDIFIAVLRALPGFRKEASLKTFIARIANNVAIDHVRKATKRLQEVEVTAAHDIADPIADQETHADLRIKREKLVECVRALDLPLRQVASLHLEGFTNAEIADALSLTANNVGVRLHRAKAELTRRLAPAAKKEITA